MKIITAKAAKALSDSYMSPEHEKAISALMNIIVSVAEVYGLTTLEIDERKAPLDIYNCWETLRSDFIVNYMRKLGYDYNIRDYTPSHENYETIDISWNNA